MTKKEEMLSNRICFVACYLTFGRKVDSKKESIGREKKKAADFAALQQLFVAGTSQKKSGIPGIFASGEKKLELLSSWRA